MSDRRSLSAAFGLLVATFAILLPAPAPATQKFGPLQLSGNLQSQNIIRNPDAADYNLVQQRNVARIRLDYDWLQAGKFYGKYDIPFIDRSKLFLLWRGVYDSIYDTTPGFIEKEDIHQKAYGGKNVFQFGTDPNGLNLKRP